MIHYMKLQNKPFEKIKNGSKTVELRLYDEKRRLVGVGDKIVFTCFSDDARTVSVLVTAIHRFDSFEMLYKNIPHEKCGYVVGETADYRDMEEYYSPEEQRKHGVVGIEFELM